MQYVPLYKNEKGMSFMNFNIENAKTFRMEWKKNYYNMVFLFTEILIISWHTEIEKRFCGKKTNRAVKLKIHEKHSSSLLIFPPEFNLERELCNSSVLSSHTWIKTLNLIISSQVREEIKEMVIC